MKKLRVTVNGVSYEVEVEVLEDDELSDSPYGYAALSQIQPPPRQDSSTESRPRSTQTSAPPETSAPPTTGEDKNVLTSPISGIVVEIKVSPGAKVKENDPVVVIEAMKINTNISSPVSGTVKSVNTAVGESVQQGQVLLTFE